MNSASFSWASFFLYLHHCALVRKLSEVLLDTRTEVVLGEFRLESVRGVFGLFGELVRRVSSR